VEDVLFAFASGAAVWLLTAPSAFARSLRFDWSPLAASRRIAIFAIVGPLSYFVMWFQDVNPMTALLIGLAICGGIVLVLRRELWPLAIPAAILYPIMHGLAVAFAFAAWPDLQSEWNSGHLWGTSLFLGVPLGEVFWAAVFGATWPLVVGYVLNAQPCHDER
jgi:hypothetical protein